jgi:hypothetical protein
MDGIGLGLCPMASSGISTIRLLSTTTDNHIATFHYLIKIIQ